MNLKLEFVYLKYSCVAVNTQRDKEKERETLVNNSLFVPGHVSKLARNVI